MVENDFTSLAHKIIGQWRNENLPLNSQVDMGERLADSFGHFIQRYSTEPEKIYLWV
jgi:hypothetical protein